MKILKKVAFRNLGCKVNEYEMEYMQQIMSENGYEIVPFDTKADIYVVNTCTVTNIADRKSRQMLHKAKKQNKDAIVVAAGCYVQTDTENAARDLAVDIIIGNNNKAKMPQIIEEYIKSHSMSADSKEIDLWETKRSDYVDDLSKDSDYEEMSIKNTQEHTRAFIKIQDGCNQFCSYCAIPLARGRIRSRSVDSILEEVTNLSKSGFKEVVITGIHLSSYGIDLDNKDNNTKLSYNELAKNGGFTNKRLIEVISKVAKIEGIKRIRLGSLEPRLITREFVEALSKIDKICPHFHLSLQSGCDETLKRMNRKYSASEFKESIRLIREYFELPAITTDVIVGFPQESDEEFEETYRFLEEVRFFELHVFKYSKRKGTPAAEMKGQVKDAVKEERSERLIALDKKLSCEFVKEYTGRQVEVLFEEEKNGIWLGHTREYIRVGTKGKEDMTNQIVEATLDGETLFFA